MSHTPAPWYYHYEHVCYVISKDIGDTAHQVAIVRDWGEDENARRIVACVNACEGLPTEALECQAKKNLTGKLIEEHAALLDALESMVCAFKNSDLSYHPALDHARAIIAKVQGA